MRGSLQALTEAVRDFLADVLWQYNSVDQPVLLIPFHIGSSRKPGHNSYQE